MSWTEGRFMISPMGMCWSRRSPSTKCSRHGGRIFPAARKKEELPREALEYIAFIEEAVGVKIKYVSVGAERDQYIVL